MELTDDEKKMLDGYRCLKELSGKENAEWVIVDKKNVFHSKYDEIIEWLCRELVYEMDCQERRTPCYLLDYYPHPQFDECSREGFLDNQERCAKCLKDNIEEAMKDD